MARIGADLRRQDFIEATVKVIAEQGVANATTRRIAAAAGSPLTSLHYVFHTKEDLFYAVFESFIDWPKQSLAHLPPGISAAETAAELFRRLIADLTTRPHWAKAQTELFLWATRSQPEMANKVYRVAIDATSQAFEDTLGPQIDKGTLDAISRLIIQLVDGLLMAWTAHGDLDRLKAEAETACEALALLVAKHQKR